MAQLAVGLVLYGATPAMLVSVLVLLSWWPLRERPGVGTVANALVVGAVIDLALSLFSAPHGLAARYALLVGGVVGNGFGTGLYIGAGLGPGPRDGVSTAIAARGHSMRVVRTGVEATVLVAGFLLGGTVGIGTLGYALSIGPITHRTIPWLRVTPGAGSAGHRPPAPSGRRVRSAARCIRARCATTTSLCSPPGACGPNVRRRVSAAAINHRPTKMLPARPVPIIAGPFVHDPVS